MNASISTADQLTHLKIIVTALAAAIIVVWVGIVSRPGGVAEGAATQTYRQVPAVSTMIADARSRSTVR
jgi:hypothetical protein